ncbi:nucleoside hydrolase [Neobacillus drentensis]|uniref:nucleoside hydrolase n=1 Tax=Neobacillus drentensis TaxID=220684 RepID=UPI0008247601|nr:nucleoside hydrolase [Neobacillus drentensis]
MKKTVIIDTDPGIDDAIAIFLALTSEKLDVKLITTTAGNQTIEKVTNNALGLVNLTGIKGIEIAKGATKPLIKKLYTAEEFHGESGLGEVVLPIGEQQESERTAVEAMKELLMNSNENVSIVAIGPLTNVANLITAYPNLTHKIEQISIMGGAYEGGNTTPVAEFNMYVDPEAAQIVFQSGIPIALFGLDVTYKAVLFNEDIEKVRSIGNRISDATADMLEFYARGRTNGLPMHDACAVAYLINPDLFTFIPCNVQVETKGEFTYGQTIIDKKKLTDQPINANVAFEVDREELSNMIYQSLKSF